MVYPLLTMAFSDIIHCAVSDQFVERGLSYDANGNMIHDGANNLALFYNHLNLIEKAEQDGATLVKYSYLSDNTKLAALDAGANGLYYLGSLVYESCNGVLSLESAAFSSGRIFAAATAGGISYSPQYHLTDHLGSVRVIVDNAGEVVERNDYYPFGLRWDEGLLSGNRYRYNGKEEQSFIGLPYTDYGARMYEPRFGLGWNGSDLLAEKYYPVSPFVYPEINNYSQDLVKYQKRQQKMLNAK